MSEFTKEIERRIDAGFMTEPQDIRRMLKHSAHPGRNFSQWLYCYMDSWKLMDDLYSIFKVALNEDSDLETIKSIANGIISVQASNFKAAHMEDTSWVLYRAIGAVNGCKTHESLAELLRIIQRFCAVMFYSLDHAVPWDGLCKAYNDLMVDFVPKDRENAVDVCDL